jgi:acyl-CoA thioesterase
LALAEASRIRPLGGSRYEGELPAGWSGGLGPHGGFVAALVLRALTAAVDDPARVPRSLTVHFVARPDEAPAEIDVTVERAGRSLTSLSARLVQAGRVRATALAAFSARRVASERSPAAAPDYPPAAEVPTRDIAAAGAPDFFHRLDLRPVVPGWVGSGSPETGGWDGLRESEPMDAAALTFLLDAWWPAVWGLLERPGGAPTIDYTVHFRRELPATEPGEPLAARFGTRLVHDGFWEEDGELWSADGRLLAHSRQLALLVQRG